MDTDDLFSFLDDNAASTSKVDIVEDVSKKKRRNGTSVVNGDSERTQKKAKVDPTPAPMSVDTQPIVLDEFETEQKREVNASAGLTGQVADTQRLELRHQVSLSSLSLFN